MTKHVFTVNQTDTKQPAAIINGLTGKIYASGDLKVMVKILPETRQNNVAMSETIAQALMVVELPKTQDMIDAIIQENNIM